MDNYWDVIAQKNIDNIWKRQELVRRLLGLDLIGKSVLEVGVGMGTAAAAISATILGTWDYKGTDVSQKNCDAAKKNFCIDVVQADLSSLPFDAGYFDVVIALDVLEHVQDKETAFKEINRVLKPWGRVVLNIPMDESFHDDDQEFGFTNKDLMRLMEVCLLRIEKYEEYSVYCKTMWRHYGWFVGVR